MKKQLFSFKTVKASFLIMLFSTLLFSSCTKDETLTPPTLTVNGGVKSTDLQITATSFDISFVATAGTSRELKTVTIQKAITGQATSTIKTYSPNKNSLTETYTDVFSGQQVGQTYTYTITATDDKSKVSTESVSVTFISSDNVFVSSSIQLGAQSNSSIEYKFLGVADNFTTYTAGTSGSARANSAKVDFVYYYGTNDKNAFASPTNTDGAQVIWGSEITAWTTKNDTKFKTTPITATEFDAVMVSKKDDTFKDIDFTSGSVSKITTLMNNNVFAFMTASGKKGLVKFTSTANDNTGAVTLVVISQK